MFILYYKRKCALREGNKKFFFSVLVDGDVYFTHTYRVYTYGHAKIITRHVDDLTVIGMKSIGRERASEWRKKFTKNC